MVFNSTRELIDAYCLEENMLYKLFDAVSFFLEKEKKIKVIVDKPITLTWHKKLRNIYKNYRVISALEVEKGLFEIPCISDGESIFLGKIQEPCGIPLRLFDLLHFGCGHLWQWSAKKGDGNLTYYGDEAWKTGAKIIEAGDIELAKKYENEAGILSRLNLCGILSKNGFSEEFSKNFMNFFNDFIEADLETLIHFCDCEQHIDLFNVWKKTENHEIPPTKLNINYDILPRRRKNIQAVFR